MRRRWLTVAGGLCAAGIAAGMLALTGCSLETPARAPAFSGEPGLPVINDTAAAGVADNPYLSRAAWLFLSDGRHRIGDVEPLPSLVFPPGVTYGQALTRLYRSVGERGRLPASATIADPLPPLVVVSEPDDGTRGVRLSLTAPFGYGHDPRWIHGPSATVDLPPREANRRIDEAATRGVALPSFMTVDVPVLSGCQLVSGDQIPGECR